ncbi:MAG TPA: hypothetical protein DDZ51_24840 [Planctomycetaceae bacterium]|nr:hypothetical protein [Planctomycetaceae bacterium]
MIFCFANQGLKQAMNRAACGNIRFVDRYLIIVARWGGQINRFTSYGYTFLKQMSRRVAESLRVFEDNQSLGTLPMMPRIFCDSTSVNWLKRASGEVTALATGWSSRVRPGRYFSTYNRAGESFAFSKR